MKRNNFLKNSQSLAALPSEKEKEDNEYLKAKESRILIL
jgi:hypothetical protein